MPRFSVRLIFYCSPVAEYISRLSDPNIESVHYSAPMRWSGGRSVSRSEWIWRGWCAVQHQENLGLCIHPSVLPLIHIFICSLSHGSLGSSLFPLVLSGCWYGLVSSGHGPISCSKGFGGNETDFPICFLQSPVDIPHVVQCASPATEQD